MTTQNVIDQIREDPDSTNLLKLIVDRIPKRIRARVGNDVSNATTAGILKTNMTQVGGASIIANNEGDPGPTSSQAFTNDTTLSKTGSPGTMGTICTIPGGSVKIGDTIRIEIGGAKANSSSSAVYVIRLAGSVITLGTPGMPVPNNFAYSLMLQIVALSGANSTSTQLQYQDQSQQAPSVGASTVDWTADVLVESFANTLTGTDVLTTTRHIVEITGGKHI